MLKNLKAFHLAGMAMMAAISCGIFFYTAAGVEAAPNADELQNEMQSVKEAMERPNSSPVAKKRYAQLAQILSSCMLNQFYDEAVVHTPFSPAANSLCINGSLAVADPTFNRPLASSTGTGVGNGTVGNCTLSGVATASHYDAIAFNVTGCAAFPTEVTATLCGAVGCQHLGNVDTTLILYRNVAAGDPLTANGGLPAVFNPASPCTNARAQSDDLGTTVGAANNPGGATCNQVNGANCIAPCTSPSNAGGLSGFRRQIGNGRFTLVISGFGNTQVGVYNLYVNAPAAGCNIALSSTAASASIGGRVLSAGGKGISNVTVSVSGGSLGAPLTARTNTFGYYTLNGLSAGETYILSVESKRSVFTNPSRIINLQESIADADFIAQE